MPPATSDLWALHTVVLEILRTDSQSGTGTRRWKCNYCSREFTSTITRVKEHLSTYGGGVAGCQQVPKEVADAVIKANPHLLKKKDKGHKARANVDHQLVDDFEASCEVNVFGRTEASLGPSRKRALIEEDDVEEISTAPGTSKTNQSTLRGCISRESWIKERQRVAEIEIERTLIECNIAFNVLRTEQWKRMVKAISDVGHCDDWAGLSYNSMRTKMLDEEKERIEVALQPIKDGWKKFGCSIISDGWSDIRRRHIINILVSSCMGTYFLRAVDAGKGGDSISAEFIYGHIKDAIEEVGKENVVQVITDNASNCKKMGEMVELNYPSIVWTPCAAHCLDLLMEDVGKLSWVRPIVLDAERITRFFRKKHQALALFRKHSAIDLVRPAKTRFAYMFLVLKRLCVVRDALGKCGVDPMWGKMYHAENEATKYIQRKVVDPDFWKEAESLVAVMRPLFVLLCMTDMEGSTMGLYYHLFMQMRACIRTCRAVSIERRDEILEYVDKRWEWMRRPIHIVSATLHPLYKSPSLFQDPELIALRFDLIDRLYGAQDRNVAIRLDQELNNYENNIGAAFSRPNVHEKEITKMPLNWWQTYGWGVPNLRKLALRLLAQDCSAGVCERNWSAYSLVHTKIRNRLSTKQLEKVVFCKANLRLIRDFKKLDQVKQVNPFDIEKLLSNTEVEDMEDRERGEQEEIYRLLHRELVTLDRRVTRASSRAYDIDIDVPSTSSRGRGRARGRGRGRGRSRGRGRGYMEEALLDLPTSSTLHLDDLGISFTPFEPQDNHSDDDDDARETVVAHIVREPEYDDEGNILTDGDFAFDSSSDDEF